MQLELNQNFLLVLCDIAREAGRAAMAFYDAPDAQDKADGSPVTLADLAADAVIAERLQCTFPHTVRVSEESAFNRMPESLLQTEFFLIDPLDGTKEFIKRNGEFTVNIALVRNRVAVAGVVHAPATGEMWMGAVGVGAFKCLADDSSATDERNDDAATSLPGSQPAEASTEARAPYPSQVKLQALHARGVHDAAGLVVMGSRSHADDAAMSAYLADKRVARFVAAGSSLKFCRLAEGVADLYPRFTPTMEWDTAAGHAVLSAAGGRVSLLDGSPLLYAKPQFRNPDFVAAAGA